MGNHTLNKMSLKALLASSLLLGVAGVTTWSNAWASASATDTDKGRDSKHCGHERADKSHHKDGKHHSKYHSEYHDKGEKHSAKMLSHLDSKLDLSSEQYGEVAGLIKAHHDKQSSGREQMHAAFKKMRSLSPASDDYLQQASTLASEQAEAMQQHMVARAQLKADIYALLTPEQQRRFAEIYSERAEAKRHGKGEH